MLLLAVIAIGVAFLPLGPSEPDVEEIPLTEALTIVKSGTVEEAEFNDSSNVLTLTVEDDGEEIVYVTQFPFAFGSPLTQALLDAEVDVSVEHNPGPNWFMEFMMRFGPMVLILAVLIYLVKVGMPGISPGKRKALEAGDIPPVTFDDVAGVDEAVSELREMVSFLRNPELFEAVGAKRPRGALLVGPPGTGKTLLARAVAGEAGASFFALAGSDFVETFVGMGARRVRDLFEQARKAERAIIFIDEIDAVGRARSNSPTTGGDSERENTLISLLNELDGFTDSNILVLAATNRADTLDSALTRPGRFDRQIQVPNPDRGGRTKILKVHTVGRPIADDVDFVQIARQTPGMSGADLAQIVNEASLEAARQERTVLDADCFQAAIATVAMGRARESALVTETDRKITAWHEAGHTLASVLVPEAPDPVSVTIIPRGPSGGATWMSGTDDIFLTRPRARAQLVVSLAGRAAEEILLNGEHTQGAAGDLEQATQLATAMVTQYGMTDFGFVTLDADTMRVGGEVAAKAHKHISALLEDAYRDAQELLRENLPALDALAEALLKEETLSGDRIREVLEGVRP